MSIAFDAANEDDVLLDPRALLGAMQAGQAQGVDESGRQGGMFIYDKGTANILNISGRSQREVALVACSASHRR